MIARFDRGAFAPVCRLVRSGHATNQLMQMAWVASQVGWRVGNTTDRGHLIFILEANGVDVASTYTISVAATIARGGPSPSLEPSWRDNT